ncbi:MAG: TraR/DksA family transcriptional regulator [Candidatus Nanopelagicales bacterium]
MAASVTSVARGAVSRIMAKKAAPAAKKAAPAAKKRAAPAAKKRAAPAAKKRAAPAAKKRAAPAAKKRAAPAARKPAAKKSLIVREDESPWTAKELAEVRAALNADHRMLLDEITNAEAGLADLIRDSGDGAGDDQADAGSKTFEREHEMSLANNARDMLDQVAHALARIDAGTYGICESCGKAVGKYRLQAFPRATLCLACKQAEERY